MIVVSDASPLHYLILIGADGILRELFGAVVVPPAVIDELNHPSTPQPVRTWVADAPSWLVVQAPRQDGPALRLGAGETQAIQLAVEFKADFLMIDERRGRAAAEELGLAVIGVLGVLIRASEMKLVDLPLALSKLMATNFRIEPALLRSILDQAEPRRGEH